MRIFITGGAGFIGSSLSDFVLGKDVFVYDLSCGDDIRNKAWLDRALENTKPDVILHLGALAGVRRGEEYPEEYYTTNVIGTENVFALAKKHGVKKVISFSSSSVFNDNNELKPISVYGRSKLMGEVVAEGYKDSIPNIYIVRPFTVYGMNGRGDQVIYKWLRQIEKGESISFFGDGETFRPYTHISDLAKAIKEMLQKDLGFQVFNLGGKKPVRLKEVLKIFKEKFGNKIKVENFPLPKADSKGKMPDNGNWKLINYKPKAEFEAELKSIINKWKTKK